jgi:hypothetical protein
LKERYRSLRPKRIKRVELEVRRVTVKAIWREEGPERAKLATLKYKRRVNHLIEATLLAPWEMGTV